jgi:heat-inducible transcriptional repressor
MSANLLKNGRFFPMKSPYYEERSNKILKAIIEDFTFTGKPVSSQSLSTMFDLSPATIRNVMAELERTEHITQPHPSAGRIPTDKGYRLYVDSLMEDEPLEEEEKEGIIQEYEQSIQHEDLIQKTSQLLSTFSHYVGISLMLKEEKIYLEGFSNLLEQPEFNDINLLKKLFKVYEDKDLLCEILTEHLGDEEISITIGHENSHQSFYECSIVTATYKIEDEPVGTIGVIGPTRMTYPHVIAVVKFIRDTIGRFLIRIY